MQVERTETELKWINYDYLTTNGKLVNSSSSTLVHSHAVRTWFWPPWDFLLLLAEGNQRGAGGSASACRRRSSGAGAHGGSTLCLPTGSQRPAQARTAKPAQAGGGALLCRAWKAAGPVTQRARPRGHVGRWWRRVQAPEDAVGWPETKNKGPAMDELAGKTAGKMKTKGKQSNGDGFKNIRTLRWRERRDLPLGGGGRRKNATVSPEKLAEEFAGNLAAENFGVRSAGLRVAARKTGCTSRILASRWTPAYIYVGFGDFGKWRYFRNYWFSELK